MGNPKELTNRLVSTLKALERERQYRGLKKYVRSLERSGRLNGKEKYFLKGALARLRRLEIDRRSLALGLTQFIPYDERRDEPIVQTQGGYLAWDRSTGLFASPK